METVTDNGVATAPGSATSVVYNAEGGRLGRILCGAALSRLLFVGGQHQLDSTGQSTWRWVECDGLSGESEFVELSDLSRRDCGGSRPKRDVRLVCGCE